jgi:hypothetical protein
MCSSLRTLPKVLADFSHLTVRYYPWLPTKLLYPILSKTHPSTPGASMRRATKKKIGFGAAIALFALAVLSTRFYCR